MITKDQICYFKKLRCWDNEFQDLEAYDRWGTIHEKQEKLSIQQMERIMLLAYGQRLIDEGSTHISEEYLTAYHHLLETECLDDDTIHEFKTINSR